MSTDNEHEETESLNGGELVYRAADPSLMRYAQEGDGPPVIEGRMMPYDEWTEVNSPIEGHFMERFAPGALAKTISEQASKIRALFEHGLDKSFGNQTIAVIDEMRDEQDGAHFRASLLDGLPPLLLAGLRRGLYGSSVRFGPVKWDRTRSPRPSESNPEGIPEVTVREAFIREFSVVTFPQYAGATARMRSLTDEVAARQLLGDPTRLLEIIATQTEPPHSVREEQEVPASERSRSTQQTSNDYLSTEEDAWLL
jgi:HK97 family phage prohead protease